MWIVEAKKFTTDGMIADKRVHVNLTKEESRELHSRYSNEYWAYVRSWHVEDEDEYADRQWAEALDGKGEGQ